LVTTLDQVFREEWGRVLATLIGFVGYSMLRSRTRRYLFQEPALERMVQDAGAYYLMGYYSTNTRLDGRFRRLTVRVKRPNVA